MYKNVEILSPAGNFQSLVAGVRCGSNAVYLGSREFSARAYCDNFSDDELKEAVKYCHGRDVKVYLALNTIIFSMAELLKCKEIIINAVDLGVDGFIIQDLGLVKLARMISSEIVIHASTQMSLFSLGATLEAKKLGISRAVLPRELSGREIKYIAENSPIETEVFVHGALCMSLSGQCYMSSSYGERSANRGRCAQPCRLQYGGGYILSLKDQSIIENLPQLKRQGVKSFKIEGRMKGPEYVASAVTAAKAALAGKSYDISTLEQTFSRSGFTSGYFDDELGRDMFGVREKSAILDAKKVFPTIHELYSKELQSVPLFGKLEVKKDLAVKLTVKDNSNNQTEVLGETVTPAVNRPLSEEFAIEQISKLGGTQYFFEKITAEVDDGCFLPASALNSLRREAVEKITNLREVSRKIKTHDPVLDIFTIKNERTKLKFRALLTSLKQLDAEVLSSFQAVSLPYSELIKLGEKQGDNIYVGIPKTPYMSGTDIKLIIKLENLYKLGYKKAFVKSIDGIYLAKKIGFSDIWADFSLNIANPFACSSIRDMGVSSINLSIENHPRECTKYSYNELETGAILYGKLPVMTTKNCPAAVRDGGCRKNCYIIDRKKERLALKCDGAVTDIYNPVPLNLSGKIKDFSSLDFGVLVFDSEDKTEILSVVKAFENGTKIENGRYTTGGYYRNIL